MLSLPLPRLTRCGLSVCTFSPLPVSIRSSGPFCRQIGWKVRFKDSRPGPELPTPSLQKALRLLKVLAQRSYTEHYGTKFYLLLNLDH